jgi:branched-chain amino acid transport system substrate-binding protein
MNRAGRITVLSAVLGLSSLALFGCGSSSSSSSATNDSAINIMATGVFQSAVISLPDAEPALKAAVAQWNAAGGVHGRKINLTICDDQFNPNLAEGCARQAVSNHDVAVISPYAYYSTNDIPILQAAGIPFVYGEFAETIDGTSSVSFPRDAGVPGLYAALGIQLAKEGCTKTGAVVASYSASTLGAQWLKNGLQAVSHSDSLSQVSVPNTEVDFSAPVATLLADKVNCLVSINTIQATTGVINALHASGKANVKLGGLSSEFTAQSLQALGSEANGLIIVGQQYRPTDTQVPAVQAAAKALHSYDPKVTFSTPFAYGGYQAVQVMEQLLGQMHGSITATTVLKALQSFCPKPGLFAGFCYSASAPVAQFPRAKNWGYLVWKAESGKAVLTSPTFETTGIAQLP